MTEQPTPDNGFAGLRKGLLEYAILRVISSKPVYAADILDKLGNTLFATSEGTLYPLLSRLKREGTLAYDWAESEAGPPRKYYRLTPSGKERLSGLQRYWQELETTLDSLGATS
jgi:PadR family transcriptional regulator, regulatory protein PadR